MDEELPDWAFQRSKEMRMRLLIDVAGGLFCAKISYCMLQILPCRAKKLRLYVAVITAIECVKVARLQTVIRKTNKITVQ